jgi:hypothetical protein
MFVFLDDWHERFLSSSQPPKENVAVAVIFPANFIIRGNSTR